MKRMISKCFVFILLVAMNVFADWIGSNSEPENMKKIDGKAYYVITSADELAWFAIQVNSGKTTINAVLANDILMGASTAHVCSKNWNPIGVDETHGFAGVLDGANHAIYGLRGHSSKYTGLV